MNQKYSTQEKRAIVTRYHRGESVANLCFETSIPRSTLYSWINYFYRAENATHETISLVDLRNLERQIQRQEKIISVLRSVDCTYQSSLKDKLYELEKLQDKYPVRVLCDALTVDRGTFYNHLLRNKKQDTWYNRRKEELSMVIREIYDESKQIYGANKIHAILKGRYLTVSPKYIRNLMNELGLENIRTYAKKDYLRLNKKKKEDLLEQQFYATRPNEIRVSDTTAFKVQGIWYYICIVIDLYNRKVVAHKISPKHTTNLITATFKIAYKERQPEGLTFHSDRGSQYTAGTFTGLLENLSIKQSFSPSRKPCHNAVVESFFSTLKKEELYRTDYTSYRHFKESIANYMDFYNDKRPHSTLNFKTPNAYEQAYFNRHIEL